MCVFTIPCLMGNGLIFRLRRVAVWALLVPFLLHSLIATAVMPAASANGPVLVLCIGDGLIEVIMDPLTGEPVHKKSTDLAGQCDWAAGNVVANLHTGFEAPTIIGFAKPTDLPPSRFILIASAATGLPPSTGPPAVI